MSAHRLGRAGFLIGAGRLLLLLACTAGCSRKGPVVLFDFEEERDLDRIAWRCHDRFTLSDAWSASGLRSLRCELPRETYPGIRFLEFENDWRPYGSLSFHIRNEGADTLQLVVRVDDSKSGEEVGNRYNGRFPVPPGATKIEVPMREVREGPEHRELDLGRIRLFMLFLWNEADPPVLSIDRIALE